jgi:nicotinamide-nucleotide amidase
MWFEKNGVIFVSMPGVPHEMKGIMMEEVLPRIREKMNLPAIVHRTLLTAGIGESFLAEIIQEWEEALPENIKLAYLPNYGMVRLRLTGHGPDKDLLTRQVEIEFEKLKPIVGEWLVTDRDEKMEQALGRLLQAKGLTMATAESCTGGFMSHLVTSIPGSSQYFAGSVVSYSNEVKTHVLGVNAETISENGAVSQPVVEQMVRGVLSQTGADVAIAVSGIMGPDGGSLEKPVGTVWVAVGNASRVESKKLHFRFDRMRNIELTATHGLNYLRQFIVDNH